MSLTTPSTSEVNDNIVAQIEATLNEEFSLLPKAFIRVLAKALSGVFILLFKYGGFVFQQQFIRTASAKPVTINGIQVIPLIEKGNEIGVGQPGKATHAELTIQVTVKNQIGFLPVNAQLKNKKTGVVYVTLNSVQLNADTVLVDVKAVSDSNDARGAGTLGNLEVGETLQFVNAVNTAKEAIVTAVVVTAADAENIEDVYRQRVLDRSQQNPQGGAYADYKLWAEEPAGIRKAYPYRSNCPGQVNVFIESTIASSGNVDGIPTNAQMDEALSSIELPGRRPVGALVNVHPIYRTTFDIEIIGLVTEDPETVRQTIEQVITEYFHAREPFINGLSLPPRLDRISAGSIVAIVNDIVINAGGILNSVRVLRGGILMDQPYTLGFGEKSKAGTFNYFA